MTRDLSVFVEDNARWKAQKKRVSWDERLQLIEQEFPAVRQADWNVILRDNDIFGRIIKDILKVDQVEPGRAGPRPALDYERGMQAWREMTGQDFSEEPFTTTLRRLVQDDSYTQIARKTMISRTRVYKLAQGWAKPTVDDLRSIADAYNKKPGFFAEYRAEYIMASIAARLLNEAEMTIAIYMKLVRA